MSGSHHSLRGAGGRRGSAPPRHSGPARLLPSCDLTLLEALRVHPGSVAGESDREDHVEGFHGPGVEAGTSLCPCPIGQNWITWPWPAAGGSGKCGILVWSWKKWRPPAGSVQHFGQWTWEEEVGVGRGMWPGVASVCGLSPCFCHSPSPERGHGGRDPSHVLHPAGIDAQGATLRAVRPPCPGLCPALHPRRLPNPAPSRWWPGTAWAERPIACLLGSRASSRPFGYARRRPPPGSLPGAGELSLGPCVSRALHCHVSACSGSLGTLPCRGCWWVLGCETWYLSGLFIKSVPSGCQALSGCSPLLPGGRGVGGLAFQSGRQMKTKQINQRSFHW